MATLPPGVDSLSSHQFGTLKLGVVSNSSTLLQDQLITQYRVLLLGMDDPAYKPINEAINYPIVTDLWHFYAYLSDVHRLAFEFVCRNGEKCSGEFLLPLKDQSQLLNPQYISHSSYENLLENNNQWPLEVYECDSGKLLTEVTIDFCFNFDLQMHEMVKDVIDFGQLLVINGVSPIQSENELPREPPSQSIVFEGTFKPSPNSLHNHKKHQSPGVTRDHIKPKQKPSPQSLTLDDELSSLRKNYLDVMTSNQATNNNVKQPNPLGQQKEEDMVKMMDDDIDRLVAEMQSKPYDCSKYQGNDNQYDNQRNNGNHTSEKTINRTMTNFSSHAKIPSDNLVSRTLGSPMPPRPTSTHRSIQRSHSNSGTRSKNKSISKQYRSQSIVSPMANSEIRIKIYELLITHAQPLLAQHTEFGSCFSVRVYINQEVEEYFSAQGVPEGENLIFNQDLRLRNLSAIQSIRFVLIDEYGCSCCEGLYNITRLYNSSGQKGIFMIPMTHSPEASSHHSSETWSSQSRHKVTLPSQKLSVVENVTHRTLRIEAELIERVEIVQVYIKMQQFNIPFHLVRYKIPFSKESIEFVQRVHENIFPHHKQSDKIIVEFWRGEQMVGQADISLRQVRNMNSTAVNANAEPIYLYDGPKQIRDPFNDDKIIGRFNLQLCFGNVKQIQGLLSRLGQRKKKEQSHDNRVQVNRHEQLGVLVKERKKMTEAEVQVHLEHEHQETGKYSHCLQFGIESRVSYPPSEKESLTSRNQFIENRQQYQEHHTDSKVTETDPQIEDRTISEIIAGRITQMLRPIIPHLSEIKKKCKPHLLYNFIEIPKFIEILQQLGFANALLSKIFQEVLVTKGEMININIFYDFCLDVEIDGKVRQTLISDSLLVEGAFRILYSLEKIRDKLLLHSDMQFKEMKNQFKNVGAKVTMHQYNTLSAFLNKIGNKHACIKLKQSVIDRLKEETVSEMKKQMYQQEILTKIYGDNSQSSFDQSQLDEQQTLVDSNHLSGVTNKDNSLSVVTNKESLRSTQINQVKLNAHIERNERNEKKHKDQMVEDMINEQLINDHIQLGIDSRTINNKDQCRQISKHQKHENILKINGLEGVKQSVQCLTDTSMEQAYLRIRIEEPTFQEVIIRDPHQKQMLIAQDINLEDADGIAELCDSGKVIVCARFSLIKGVQSVYSMQNRTGQFCGLLHLGLF